jgi:hypothetical protein
MKYIQTTDDGIAMFDQYYDYIESIKSRLPKHVYDFASNDKYYNLTDHSSLHDAWLEYFNIREIAEGDRSNIRRIEIESSYLGSFHDCRIDIIYKDVQSFSINTLRPPLSSNVGAHGDLTFHELRLENSNILVHEIIYSTGSIYIIKCHDIIHNEVSIPKNHWDNKTQPNQALKLTE